MKKIISLIIFVVLFSGCQSVQERPEVIETNNSVDGTKEVALIRGLVRPPNGGKTEEVIYIHLYWRSSTPEIVRFEVERLRAANMSSAAEFENIRAVNFDINTHIISFQSSTATTHEIGPKIAIVGQFTSSRQTFVVPRKLMIDIIRSNKALITIEFPSTQVVRDLKSRESVLVTLIDLLPDFLSKTKRL